jgi:hypothetical protein
MSEDCHDSNNAESRPILRIKNLDRFRLKVEPVHPSATTLLGQAHTHRSGEHCHGCAELFKAGDDIFLISCGIKP